MSQFYLQCVELLYSQQCLLRALLQLVASAQSCYSCWCLLRASVTVSGVCLELLLWLVVSAQSCYGQWCLLRAVMGSGVFSGCLLHLELVSAQSFCYSLWCLLQTITLLKIRNHFLQAGHIQSMNKPDSVNPERGSVDSVSAVCGFKKCVFEINKEGRPIRSIWKSPFPPNPWEKVLKIKV